MYSVSVRHSTKPDGRNGWPALGILLFAQLMNVRQVITPVLQMLDVWIFISIMTANVMRASKETGKLYSTGNF